MLNWWIKSGYKLEYTNKGIDIASARGLIHILNWWKNSGLELKYSEKAINDASHNNFVNGGKNPNIYRKCNLLCMH